MDVRAGLMVCPHVLPIIAFLFKCSHVFKTGLKVLSGSFLFLPHLVLCLEEVPTEMGWEGCQSRGEGHELVSVVQS